MSVSVTERYASGCPKPPVIPRYDKDIQLANGNTISRVRQLDPIRYVEETKDKVFVQQWGFPGHEIVTWRNARGREVQWNFYDDSWTNFHTAYEDSVTARGEYHGLRWIWKGSEAPRRLEKHFLAGFEHGWRKLNYHVPYCYWRGECIPEEEYLERLPTATQFVPVLSWPVAVRLCRFL